ncbi:MAG: mandelate racemase/muconate lactonizing enzyme family protein [Candidatus Handelsmanbacteria bacterium]|nr:mandelate racemase/muconate lactonizing enzyme family protein [Candidatus Handelsmanbacteria bacterium]
MKITRVEALHLRLPQVKEVADGTQDCLLVRLYTDEGLTGLGEVVSCSYVARAVVEAPRSAPFRHGLDAILTGMDPFDLEAIEQALLHGTGWYGPGGVTRHALSGVDMALWDLRGKAEGQPLRRLLNPEAADRVPCYASALWPERPEEVGESAQDFAAQGYRAVKYGWGPMGKDAALDEELVAAARQALGTGVDLMVDAGRAWDADTALERAGRFARYRIAWLEEPLHPYDYAGHGRLCAASSVPIAGGEFLTLLEDYERLLGEGGIQIVQPDLGRVGGISWGQRLAGLAGRYRCRPVPHAYGTGVLLAASAQWAAALEEPLTEYTSAPSPLARDLARHTLAFRGGELYLDDTPGLGVEIDESVVAQYRVN